jgi:hypothetical protein
MDRHTATAAAAAAITAETIARPVELRPSTFMLSTPVHPTEHTAGPQPVDPVPGGKGRSPRRQPKPDGTGTRRSVLGPHRAGERRTTAGTGGHRTLAETAGCSTYRPLTSDGGDWRSGVRVSPPGCREPSGLLPTAWWVTDERASPCGRAGSRHPPGETAAGLTGRATRVPEAAVTSGMKRTTTVTRRGPLAGRPVPDLG